MEPSHTVDCCHDKADLGGICGASKVRVNLLRLVLVQADESVQDVVARGRIIITTLVIGEVVLHRADRQLLLESVDLVEEENDGGLDEPSGVAD